MKFVVKWRKAGSKQDSWNDFDPPKYFDSIGEAQDFIVKAGKVTSGSTLYRIFMSEPLQEFLERLAITIKSIIHDAINSERIINNIYNTIEEFVAKKAISIEASDLFERLTIEVKVSFDS